MAFVWVFLLLSSQLLVARVDRICETNPYPHLERESFRSSTNYIVTQFESHHMAQDAVVAKERAVRIEGKWTYGLGLNGVVHKSLKGEMIELWMDVCEEGYRLIGRARTNDSGRSHIELWPAVIPQEGRYRLYQRVVGDNSFAISTLYVLPENAHLTVFDIDETLTVADAEFLKDLAGGRALARKGAKEVTLKRDQESAAVVYLTGRSYLFSDITHAWLSHEGMARGPVFLRQRYPMMAGLAEYKYAVLEHLQSMGFVIDMAYGNATTDIEAYGRAKIPLEYTYILGRHGGKYGTVALGEDFMGHVGN